LPADVRLLSCPELERGVRLSYVKQCRPVCSPYQLPYDIC